MSDKPIENLAVGWLPGVNVPAHPPDAVSGAATPAQQDDAICKWCTNVILPPDNDHSYWRCAEDIFPHRCGENPKGPYRGHEPAAEPAATPEAQIPDSMQVRRALWLGHGHSGMYGDDGEMQCNECPIWDYKRAPFLQIAAQAHRSLLVNAQVARAQLAALRVERDEALELLREVRSTWVVMRAADEIPMAQDWCERADKALARPIPAEQGEG